MAEDVAQPWLALHCQSLPGTLEGLIVRTRASQDAILPVAYWPKTESETPDLLGIARSCLAGGDPVIVFLDFGAVEEVPDNLREGMRQVVFGYMTRKDEKVLEVAYTTVLTFLTRLEQKGCVTSDKSDLAYVYRPKVTRDKVSRSRLDAVLESFYDGSPGPLVLQLIREGKFTKDEITELQDVIDGLDVKPQRRSRS